MAKVFNGNMWSGIGSSINNQRAYRDEQMRQGINDLMNGALGVEKMVANNKMRSAILDYYKEKEDAAAAAANADALAGAEMVYDQLAREQAFNELDELGDLEGSIFADDDKTIVTGPMFKRFSAMNIPFSSDDGEKSFVESFDPDAASPEDIMRMQKIIGLSEDEIRKGKGNWGPKSRAAFAKYKGA